MSDERAAALERLAAARARFAERLPGRVDDLRRALVAGRDDSAGLAEAVGLAHRLAGTAGSFGLPEVGEVAAALEHALIEARDGTPDWPALDAAFAALVDRVANRRG